MAQFERETSAGLSNWPIRKENITYNITQPRIKKIEIN